MNLTAERNAVTGLEKRYVYDNLNRLEQYSFSNAGFAIYDSATPFAATVDYGYDAVGNLLKSLITAATPPMPMSTTAAVPLTATRGQMLSVPSRNLMALRSALSTTSAVT